jgi:hypothetical protein
VSPRCEAWSRRNFLAVGWLPFFRPKHIHLAGARFRIHRNGGGDRRYLLIHGNEEDAREVLLAHIQTHQGIAYEVEGHERNVTVNGGLVDPNRVFSAAGAEASLKRLNPDWPAEKIAAALEILGRGREKLARALLAPKGGLTVALHNNSASYSVEDERAISDAVSIREPGNPHAFFLCTNPADYGRLSESGYNVVLQRQPPGPDDGSLSRLAAARGVRYVNLEVGLGNATRQKEMLDWLEWVLPAGV